MKKSKVVKQPIRNPVARNAGKFNKAVVMADRKNDYVRNPKHKKGEEE